MREAREVAREAFLALRGDPAEKKSCGLEGCPREIDSRFAASACEPHPERPRAIGVRSFFAHKDDLRRRNRAISLVRFLDDHDLRLYRDLGFAIHPVPRREYMAAKKAAKKAAPKAAPKKAPAKKAAAKKGKK